MKSISYSAPAKVILSGEHAVVYGKPALACALNLRLTFTVKESKSKRQDKAVLHISNIIKKHLKRRNILFKDRNFTYTIISQIPVGRGLGSSAALSVASVAALWEFYTNEEAELETINNLAYTNEKYFHQNPSGIDNTVSCFGGLVFFRKEFEFLKTISLLNSKITQKITKNLYLVDSGKPAETTKEMVLFVGKRYNQFPAKTEAILNKIEKVTKRMIVSINSENISLLRESIVENQKLLDQLGIVSDDTKKLLYQLSDFGTGKITGAGGKKTGSGYILFFADEPNEFRKYCKSLSLSFLKFNQSADGVKRETNNAI